MNPRQIQVIRCPLDGLDDSIQKTLTTRFVFDWRLKSFKTGEGQEVMTWMRRARLVARECAFAEGQRDDVFSAASSSHLLRLLPVLYLHRLSQYQLADLKGMNSCLLGCLDIKDAFLQVPQQQPLRLKMHGGESSVCRNIPGQRVGARAWLDHISNFLKESLGFKACVLNPCLLRNEQMVVLVHVDDMMVMGEGQYVRDVFIPMLKSKFELSCNFLEKVGDEISFLKRSYKLLDDGISILPGKNIQNMVEAFETVHGVVKRSKVPCDASIQTADSSALLNAEDSVLYRFLVGMAIYLGQERYDICFTVKELASKMSKAHLLFQE